MLVIAKLFAHEQSQDSQWIIVALAFQTRLKLEHSNARITPMLTLHNTRLQEGLNKLAIANTHMDTCLHSGFKFYFISALWL